jgi:hypothetical protein
MRSEARTVAAYLAALPADRRAAIARVRRVILDHLPKGYEEAYRATGKRMDLGRSCVRFKRIDDLPLELIGRTIAATPVEDFLARRPRPAS